MLECGEKEVVGTRCTTKIVGMEGKCKRAVKEI
jgi:hypothetical protein